MKSDLPPAEERLLDDVVLDAPLRRLVHGACIQELRTRALQESHLLQEVLDEPEGTISPRTFLEHTRGECLATLHPTSARLLRSRVLQLAATLLVLSLAWALTRPPAEPVPASVPAPSPEPATPPPAYLVRSQPVAADMIVRTDDHHVPIPRITDDELVSTFPDLSVARTRDLDGNPIVFVAHPATRQIHRLN